MNRAIRLSGSGLPQRGQETTKYLEQWYKNTQNRV